jgi:spore maturation protein A
MINWLWAFLIIFGIILALFTGSIEPLVNVITSSAKDAAVLLITLMGTYTLWLGVLNIAKKSGLIEQIAKKAEPIIAFLFKDIPKQSKANGLITMNIIANMLGMGNAATPFGLMAMKELQKYNPNKEKATDAMCMLLIINATSVQLLPLTVISLRVAAGSISPTDIILTSLITTFVTTLTGIILGKIFAKTKRLKQNGGIKT